MSWGDTHKRLKIKTNIRRRWIFLPQLTRIPEPLLSSLYDCTRIAMPLLRATGGELRLDGLRRGCGTRKACEEQLTLFNKIVLWWDRDRATQNFALTALCLRQCTCHSIVWLLEREFGTSCRIWKYTFITKRISNWQEKSPSLYHYGDVYIWS